MHQHTQALLQMTGVNANSIFSEGESNPSYWAVVTRPA